MNTQKNAEHRWDKIKALDMSDLLDERARIGEFPAWTWPDCYPIFYVLEDGGILCPKCANGGNGSIASVDHDDPRWNITAAGVHWDGKPIVCDHCTAKIESAHGEGDE